jgi:hypothetical protein
MERAPHQNKSSLRYQSGDCFALHIFCLLQHRRGSGICCYNLDAFICLDSGVGCL